MKGDWRFRRDDIKTPVRVILNQERARTDYVAVDTFYFLQW
jgi:hypothetical protein